MEDIARAQSFAYLATVTGFGILGSVAGAWISPAWGFLGLGCILYGTGSQLYTILWFIWSATQRQGNPEQR